MHRHLPAEVGLTRAELLARRALLLKIAANPEHELQHVEVSAELDWIAEQLKVTE